jgi:hypothetical protein
MPRVRVPRHVARLVTRLVIGYFASRRLVVDYFTYARVRMPRHVARLVTRLIVDYFTYAARPVASAHRAACRVTHLRLLRLAQTRRRLLRLRCASMCLGTSRDSSCGSSSTTSTTPRVPLPRHVAWLVAPLVVDYSTSCRLVVKYFGYAACPGASARRTDRRRLLRVRRASGCLSTSRGSLSTTSPTSCVLMPRHLARLVAPLVVDYFAYAVRPGASARRTAHRAAHRQLLRLRRASCCFGTSLGTSRGSSSGSSLTTSP